MSDGQEFLTAMKAYERGMKSALGSRFHRPDIKKRRKKMAESAFVFLRATCWRWAAHAMDLCPELTDLPAVPSVGDAHADNFALWRDAEVRLVWGISDYDEAAELPFAFDLVRLCVSVLLADQKAEAGEVCSSALGGYGEGLAEPKAFVLERKNLWLRDEYAASDEHREEYWADLEKADKKRPDADFVTALRAALPDREMPVKFSRRSAGAGSLGRDRFVAYGLYRGGPVAVEAKAALPSCWPVGRKTGLAAKMATGPSRSPDPWLRYRRGEIVRRLAPNSSKVDYKDMESARRMDLVTAMATELGSVHFESEKKAERVTKALAALDGDWLVEAATRVAQWTGAEFEAYQAAYRKGEVE